MLALALPARRATARAWRAERPGVDPPSELVTATVARFASELAPAARRGDGGLAGRRRSPGRRARRLERDRGRGPAGAGSLWSVDARAAGDGRAGAAASRSTTSGSPPGCRIGSPRPTTGSRSWTSAPRVRRRRGALDAARLPPLLVAWRADSGGHSGDVHAPLRDRHADGEPVVLEAMRALTARGPRRRPGDRATATTRPCARASTPASTRAGRCWRWTRDTSR